MSNQAVKADRQIRVLVVDDEPAIADFISEILSAHGYQVRSFSDPEAALEVATRTSFDLALIDINMPLVDGVRLSRQVLEYDPETEIIIITGVPDETNLDPCLKMGLTHFLFKPFNDSQLVYTVYAALHFKRLRRSSLAAGSKAEGSGLTGVCISVRDIRQEIASVATTDLPVLVIGESGTGKEIVARDLHRNSKRAARPFLPIKCAVLGSLAESELFGHASGAFTGAGKSAEGYVGAADGGGRDLFFRLSGSIIRTAPLRERKADVVPLIWHFLSLFGTAKNITYNISAEACSRLIEEDWPGNVRQLKQTLYKICQTAATRKLTLADVQRVLGDGEVRYRSYREAKQQLIDEFDREYLLKTLYLAQGSLKKALALSGMHKKNFYEKIKQLGLSVKVHSRPADR